MFLSAAQIIALIGVGTGGAGGALAPPVKNVGGREYPSAPPVFMAENPLFWCLSEYLNFVCTKYQAQLHNVQKY